MSTPGQAAALGATHRFRLSHHSCNEARKGVIVALKTKEESLAWLRKVSGDLATSTLARLDQTLPWYREMPPSRRSAVGLVAQAGITSFIRWYDDPQSSASMAADVFNAAPRDLLRSVSLQETLQLIRVTVEVVEEQLRGRSKELHDAVLLYSRELAFAAADVYAKAAEARGLWDQRLEALVVDSILAGEYDGELPSRIAALGWSGSGDVAVLVGTTPKVLEVDHIRRIARKHNADALVGVQGTRLVVVLGHRTPEGEHIPGPTDFADIAREAEEGFGPGPLVVGPTVPSILDAANSARAALQAFSVAKALRTLPRPLLADDALPERSLAGDGLAREALISAIYEPLKEHPLDLLRTVWTYFETGHSLELTARELFVHPNTVRYRLKKVADLLDWDPALPRDAAFIHTAIVLGRIGERSVQLTAVAESETRVKAS